jgi:predicted glycoside hydrolase/deacetylase ChbG (UPF0249 family)
MTLEDAIKHCREVAKENREQYKEYPEQDGYIERFYDCLECAQEHEQLASWLKELQAFRDSKTKVIKRLKYIMNHGVTDNNGRHIISLEFILPLIKDIGEVTEDE